MFCFIFQVAALGAISNIVVDFTPHKSTFIQCGGIKELVQLTKSMDSSLRLNAVRALRNMVFLTEKMCKEGIFVELTASSMASLICGIDTSGFSWLFSSYQISCPWLCILCRSRAFCSRTSSGSCSQFCWRMYVLCWICFCWRWYHIGCCWKAIAKIFKSWNWNTGWNYFLNCLLLHWVTM